MRPQATKMSPYQLGMLLVPGIAATAVLFLPASTVTFALRDGWMAPLVAAPVPLAVIWIVASLARRFPAMTMIEYAPKLLGTVPGKIVGALMLFYFFHLDAMQVREFGDFLVLTATPETPISIVMAMGMIATVWATLHGPEVLGRVAEVFTPLSVIFIVTITLLAMNDMKIDYLRPVMEFGPVPLLRGALITQAFLGEVVVLAMLFPSVTSVTKGTKACFAGLAVILFLLLVTGIATVALLGDTAGRFTAPFFTVTRIASIGPALSRIDPLVIGFWIGGVALKTTLFFYATVVTFTQLFNLSDYRPFTLPMAALVMAFGLSQVRNIVEFGALISYVWPFYRPIFEIGIPALLLVAAYVRGVKPANV